MFVLKQYTKYYTDSENVNLTTRRRMTSLSEIDLTMIKLLLFQYTVQQKRGRVVEHRDWTESYLSQVIFSDECRFSSEV